MCDVSVYDGENAGLRAGEGRVGRVGGRGGGRSGASGRGWTCIGAWKLDGRTYERDMAGMELGVDIRGGMNTRFMLQAYSSTIVCDFDTRRLRRWNTTRARK